MKYHIDTDMGVDDSLALVVANALLGPSLIALSTVFGNVDVATATRNALIFRRLFKRDDNLRVISGARQARDGFFRDAKHIHGADGLGGATAMLQADFLAGAGADEIEAWAPPSGLAAGDKITIIALGPLTNVPRLVERYGRQNVSRIVTMCGVFLDQGNISPWAEFNAYCDPHALNATLSLGIPVTIVPLDLARKVQLSRQAMSAPAGRESSPLINIIVAAHMTYMNFYREWEGLDGCFPHDALAVYAALQPDWFYRVNANVTADEGAEKRGLTAFRFDKSSDVSIVFGGELKKVREALGHWGQYL